jgi:predicted lipid-binding transport protein (Tim44 family)
MAPRKGFFFGVLSIFLIFFLLVPMLAGATMRRRAVYAQYYAQVAAAQSAETATSEATVADNSATSSGESSNTSSPYSHSRSGNAYHTYHHSSAAFFGMLLRLALIGGVALFIVSAVRRYETKDDDDDLADEIRIGDEINRAKGADMSDIPDPDEMTVDDLVRAMKRLGIKKLEL